MALVTTLWGQKLSSNANVHRDTMREALPALPSLARALPCDEVTVTSCPPTASETQARMAEVTSGKAVPSLPCISLWKHTQQQLCLPRYTDIQSQCFQQDRLKEVLPLKAWIGTEVPRLALGRWQDWCSSLETQVLTRRTSKHPHHWFKMEKSQLRRQWHIIPEPFLDSSVTILFIFSIQWEKLTSWTWKLSQFYWIVPSLCSATLTLHFPKLKCFISSYRQLFI